MTTFCSNHTIKKTFSFSASSPNTLSQSSKTKSSSLLRLRLAGKQQCRVSGNDTEKNNEVVFPEGLDPERMPKHIGVIMDGNRRWAKSKGLTPQNGYTAGGEAFKKLCINCHKYGVKTITIFAFSTENWVRRQDEVDFMMEMFREVFTVEYMKQTQKEGVRFNFVGNREPLPVELQKVMRELEEASKDFKNVQVVVAINYGGRYDITQATKRIATKVRDGVLEVEEIDDGVFEKHLQTNGLKYPDPDLMIRTSGEQRLSNFMLWQLAYTELVFIDKMFPDLDHADIVQALTAFQNRKRRFGAKST